MINPAGTNVCTTVAPAAIVTVSLAKTFVIDPVITSPGTTFDGTFNTNEAAGGGNVVVVVVGVVVVVVVVGVQVGAMVKVVGLVVAGG